MSGEVNLGGTFAMLAGAADVTKSESWVFEVVQMGSMANLRRLVFDAPAAKP